MTTMQTKERDVTEFANAPEHNVDDDTADGRNPANHLGCINTLQKNAIKYQPQLVQDFFYQQYYYNIHAGAAVVVAILLPYKTRKTYDVNP